MKKANTQAKGVSPRSGTKPPEDKQFGKPNGNKRGRGFWKKEDTPRFKLEQMMKMTEDELLSVYNDPKAPLFEKKLAKSIRNGQWREIESMINQVYGSPKQTTISEVNGSMEISGLNISFDSYKEAKNGQDS